MIRLAWHWLERWHEPLSVGASVALLGLVYLMPVSPRSTLAPSAGQPLLGTASQPVSQRSRADAQYYRDQWTRETAQYYALHPPRRDERPVAGSQAPAVTTAKASFAESQPARHVVAQAAHVTTASPPQPRTDSVGAKPMPLSAAPMEPPAWFKRWRIMTSLAAGLLAGLAFVSVWSAAPNAFAPGESPLRTGGSATLSGPAPAEACNSGAPLAAEAAPGQWIAIRLPAAWVGVRPTSSETIRRAILAASYLIASLCGWSLIG